MTAFMRMIEKQSGLEVKLTLQVFQTAFTYMGLIPVL